MINIKALNNHHLENGYKKNTMMNSYRESFKKKFLPLTINIHLSEITLRENSQKQNLHQIKIMKNKKKNC